MSKIIKASAKKAMIKKSNKTRKSILQPNKNNKKMLFYESIASDFDAVVNRYDTMKRLHVVFDELLTEKIAGKKVLDAGCGTGWFSQRAAERKARVTSMDVGEKLLKEVRKKCRSTRVVGSIMDMPFRDNTFDIAITSEVIEHVTDSAQAIRELYRVLKPGGILILTTPNKLWRPAITLAHLMGVRPYNGIEHWHSFPQLLSELEHVGFVIQDMGGIHLFPFILPSTYPILDFFHRYRHTLGSLMVNIAVRSQKPKSSKKAKTQLQ